MRETQQKYTSLLGPRTPLQKGKVVVSLGVLVWRDIPQSVIGKLYEHHTKYSHLLVRVGTALNEETRSPL